MQLLNCFPTLRSTARLFSVTLVFALSAAISAEGARPKPLSHAEKVARARADVYRVKRGDTVVRIARKFRTSVALIRRWNRIKSKDGIRAGSRLFVPARSKKGPRTSRRRPKAPGEIESSSWHTTKAGTSVFLPSGYVAAAAREIRFARGVLDVRIYARAFVQGEAALLEIRRAKAARAGVRVLARFAGSPVPLTETPYGYRALIPFSPYRKPGKELLMLSVRDGSVTTRMSFSVPIAKGQFKTVVWKSFLGNYDRPPAKLTAEQRRAAALRAKAARELVQASTRKKKEAFSKRSADKLDARLAHPRGHHIVTDPFFVNRRISQYYVKNRRKHWKRPFTRMHHGLDLHGKTGAPIYAVASGVVVAAQRMFYEGNFTVIDHGHGVFTGYMHQSRMLVKEGQLVNAGQKIGEVGATGRVTGPHLHAGLYIRDVPVHPLSLLALPVR